MLTPGPEGFIDRIAEPDGLPDWISQDEFDHYVGEFSRNGFTAPLNWYRNFDRNWELTATTPAADHRCADAVRRRAAPTRHWRSPRATASATWSPATIAR